MPGGVLLLQQRDRVAPVRRRHPPGMSGRRRRQSRIGTSGLPVGDAGVRDHLRCHSTPDPFWDTRTSPGGQPTGPRRSGSGVPRAAAGDPVPPSTEPRNGGNGETGQSFGADHRSRPVPNRPAVRRSGRSAGPAGPTPAAVPPADPHPAFVAAVHPPGRHPTARADRTEHRRPSPDEDHPVHRREGIDSHGPELRQPRRKNIGINHAKS